MTDRNINLTRRKLIVSAGTVGAAGIAAGYGTGALFSDQEAIANNSITAGTLDLNVTAELVEASEYYISSGTGPNIIGTLGTADGAIVAGLQVADIKPGDWIIVCFQIDIEGNPGYIQILAENFQQYENGQTEPESDVDSSNGGSLGPPIDGLNQGELQDHLLVEVYDDYDSSGSSDPPRSYLNQQNENLTGTARQVLGKFVNGVFLNQNGTPIILRPNDEPVNKYFLFELPADVGNEIQSDALTIDLVFRTEQTRNNSVLGDWIQTEKITAENSQSNSFFGSSVDLNSSVLIIGADGEASNGTNAGAAYVYTGPDEWNQTTRLTASDGSSKDLFGESVAISSDIAVVGAPGDEHGTGENSGAAYVFNQTNNGWQETKLIAGGAGAGASFGQSVATDGNIVAVGADGIQQSNFNNAGAIYIFEFDDSGWTQTAVLTPNSSNSEDYFGVRTALNTAGDRLAVSAYGNDHKGESAGAVYVFDRTGTGTWTQTAMLTASDGAANDYFGSDLSISDDTLVIGAFASDQTDQDSGAAYIFREASDGWTQASKLTASDASAQDFFGWTTAVYEDTVLVGAYRDNTRATDAGAIYIYRRNNNRWTETTKLTSADATAFDRFGVVGDIGKYGAVVTATGDETGGPDTGAAYIFQS